MDRVATDVAKPPVGGGELPSFEELLAKGSFHARLARARAEREKVLAEAGDDGFILDTRRKPWEKQDAAGNDGGPPTRVLDATVATEARRSVVTPLRPERRRHAVGERGNRQTAEVLLLRPNAAVKVVALKPDSSRFTQAPRPGAATAAKQVAVPVRQVLPNPAPMLTPSRLRRVFMVGSGFAAGLLLGVAAAALAPLVWATVMPVPVPPPVTAAADPQPLAFPPVPAAPAGGIAVASASAPVSRTEPPLPMGAASPDAPPAIPSTVSGLAIASGPAQPSPPAAAERLASLPAPARLSAAPSSSAAVLHPTGSPDAAPVFERPAGRPTAPAGRSTIAAVNPRLDAGSTDAPPMALPFAPPDDSALVRLAIATAADAPPGPPELPPAGGPRFAGPVVLNAPSSIGDAELATLVEGLGAEGFVLAEPNRVNLTISESNVRYFHAADAAAAVAVAAELGAKARDFTAFSPAPPAGTIEVWLAGRGDGAAPQRTRRASGQPSVSAADRELNALRARILQQLRNGDHL